MDMGTVPNIIICMADQLRSFELGCYGNHVIHTPNVDRFATEGIRFETAVTNFPICMAARSVLLSGQYNRWCTGGVTNIAYPSRPGDFNMPEYPDPDRPHLKDPTLAEVLRDMGYHTAAIGKWHIHSWPDDLGFEDYLIPRVHHCQSGQAFTHNGGPEFVPPGYSVDFEAEQVEAFLADPGRQEQPFFLYYNISIPHCPLADAPENFRTMYSPEAVPLRPNVNLDEPLQDQDYWFKVYRWDFRFYNLGLPFTKELPSGYTLRHLIAEYYGVTTWMDQAVGRLLQALETNGLAENTIVVFTADHGDNLGSHGLVQKGGPTEEAIRIPLIVRWPLKLATGVVIENQIASLVDLAPTLVSLAGGDRQVHMHGRDLSSLLLGGQSLGLENAAYVETSAGVGLRTPFSLYFLPWQGTILPIGLRSLAETPLYFFDLQHDPYQFHNLAGSMQPTTEGQVGLDRRLRNWHVNHHFRQITNEI